jgi:hypothetical protein
MRPTTGRAGVVNSGIWMVLPAPLAPVPMCRLARPRLKPATVRLALPSRVKAPPAARDPVKLTSTPVPGSNCRLADALMLTVGLGKLTVTIGLVKLTRPPSREKFGPVAETVNRPQAVVFRQATEQRHLFQLDQLDLEQVLFVECVYFFVGQIPTVHLASVQGVQVARDMVPVPASE